MQRSLIFVPLAASLLALSATAQAGGTMKLMAPVVLGQTASIVIEYPRSIAGHQFAMAMCSPSYPGALSISSPGVAEGVLRLDPLAYGILGIGVLDATGVSPALTFLVPNNPMLVGASLDVQGADMDGGGLITLTDNDLEIEAASPPPASANMVAIAAGTFQMGSVATGGTAAQVHQVTISRPFWIGKYEVTQAEYQALMSTNPSAFQWSSSLPVENVSWADANNYCAALTAQEAAAGRLPTGYEYRLPTEAEWEYACRAGTTTEFSFGAVPCGAVGCCQHMNYTPGCYGSTQPAGVSFPNAWGLFHMHGNVAEWCSDSWDAAAGYFNYSTAPYQSLTDPCRRSGDVRVLRGGSWTGVELFSRSAYRGYAGPGFMRNDIGFRVVLGPVLGQSHQLVPIQPGTFQMGSAVLGGNAVPVHQVSISRPFWIGKYEVTQAQYQSIMGTLTYQGSLNLRGPVLASWSDAVEFCRSLTQQEMLAGRLPSGYEFRLPTEAEWEFCCRGGTTTEWSFGDTFSCVHALFLYCIQYPGFPGFVGFPIDVGSYPPNAWGIHDMHGNVSELCLDRSPTLVPAAYSSASAFDPYQSSGAYSIMRGGSYIDNASVGRSASRKTGWIDGFRVVMAPSVLTPDLDMVRIQPGTFQMGSVAVGGSAVPVHQVTISQPFWIGKYEVTQAQYQAVMGSNPSYFQGAAYPGAANRPVELVSWSNAVAYCDALSVQEAAAGRLPVGYEYRLPTEAEWEYCCRAGTTTEFYVGSSLSCAQANFESGGGYCVPGAPFGGQTSVVGSYPANAWGLHDMHGNVFEWCLDALTYYAAGPVTDPCAFSSSGLGAVVRGGSFSNDSIYCRSASRVLPLGGTFSNCGFRVVCAPILP